MVIGRVGGAGCGGCEGVFVQVGIETCGGVL